MPNKGTAYNRVYLAPVLRTFAQIPLRGTSDTFVTLAETQFVQEESELW